MPFSGEGRGENKDRINATQWNTMQLRKEQGGPASITISPKWLGGKAGKKGGEAVTYPFIFVSLYQKTLQKVKCFSIMGRAI